MVKSTGTLVVLQTSVVKQKEWSTSTYTDAANQIADIYGMDPHHPDSKHIVKLIQSQTSLEDCIFTHYLKKQLRFNLQFDGTLHVAA